VQDAENALSNALEWKHCQKKQHCPASPALQPSGAEKISAVIIALCSKMYHEEAGCFHAKCLFFHFGRMYEVLAKAIYRRGNEAERKTEETIRSFKQRFAEL
jgi:hypothetical protein